MAYFALMYDLVDDIVNRRAQYREAHLRLARDYHARKQLVLAGALADPPDRALMVFNVADRSIVENFARNDPYVLNELVKRWEVRPWTVVVGQDEPPPAGRLA